MKILLEQLGIARERVALEWVSAAEAPRFVEKITSFTSRIRELGPLGTSEGLDRPVMLRKIAAAKISLEGMKLRTAFARQAKQVKEQDSYGELPDPEKLRASLENEITLQEIFLCLKEENRSASELAALLNLTEERVDSVLATLRKKKMINADGSII
jgi:predicted HTH transcriptional regulator